MYFFQYYIIITLPSLYSLNLNVNLLNFSIKSNDQEKKNFFFYFGEFY